MSPTAELAHRIETSVETKEGRYDWASKVEVRAYVAREVGRIKDDNASFALDILTLQSRLDELELSWWQRFKRKLGRFWEAL